MAQMGKSVLKHTYVSDRNVLEAARERIAEIVDRYRNRLFVCVSGGKDS